MIVIIDYGLGNLGSIQNMFRKIGAEARITNDSELIMQADKLVLPGVGAFDHGMSNLKELDLIPLLNRLVLEKGVPVLGICLGMQLLTNRSEEGILPGLGWIDAETIKFDFGNRDLRIPHMGWNTLDIKEKKLIFRDMYEDPRFYFVHSYYVRCRTRDQVLATTKYGLEFDSVIYRDNIFGTQFHPEKSHKFGLMLLKNYAELDLHA